MPVLPLLTTRASRVAFHRTLAYALTVLCAMVIAILTLAPVSIANDLPVNDKLYHLIAFAGLVLPSAVLYPRALLWALPFAVLFGGAIEIVQPAMGRNGEWPDFYADIWGVGLGLLVGLCVRAVLRACTRA